MKTIMVLILFLTLLSPFVTAQQDMEDIVIGKYRKVKSEFMNEERLIYVHLPEGYETSGKSYPVLFQLYAHFMDPYFIPASIITGQLGAHGKIPEMIVIGIKNREFRYRDLLPIPHWKGESRIDNFLNFFEKELIPFTRKNYRINNYRILSGPQAGAAFGIYAMGKKPDLFNAMFLSNPFWINKTWSILLNTITERIRTDDLSNKTLIISYDEKESTGALKLLKDFNVLVSSAGNNAPKLILNQLEPDFDLSVSTDIKTGLNILFKKYIFPAEKRGKELHVITDYYDSFSKEIGLKLYPPELTLVFEGDKFIKQNKLNKALKIYKYMLKIYPRSLMAMDRLGDTYGKLKDYEKAILYYEKFLEIQKGNPRAEAIIDGLKKKLKIK